MVEIRHLCSKGMTTFLHLYKYEAVNNHLGSSLF